MTYNQSITDEGWKAFAAGLAVRCCAAALVLLFFFLCGYRSPPSPVTPLVNNLISMMLLLQENKTLQTLDLGYNKIGDEGTKALAKAIEVCSSFCHCCVQLLVPRAPETTSFL
jgi:hypothetical protein